jgi:quercetin dioxygenase-like cupin family protein
MALKNIEINTVMQLADLVSYQPGQIASKTIAQNKSHSLTLFAFDKGEEISTHKSDGDAMVICLEGTGQITIEDEKYIINSGDTIIMPANKPHAVYAKEKFKMFLIVVFS